MGWFNHQLGKPLLIFGLQNLQPRNLTNWYQKWPFFKRESTKATISQASFWGPPAVAGWIFWKAKGESLSAVLTEAKRMEERAEEAAVEVAVLERVKV